MIRTVHASAPGSMMLTGEHAVVYGHWAIVVAVDQRIDVRISERPARSVRVVSDICDPVKASLDDLPEGGPLRFVFASVRAFRDVLPGGISVDIRSAIDPTMGFGSSAAVTVALMSALNTWCGHTKDLPQLHAEALAVVRSIQGRGSGADLGASFYGGVLAYKAPETVGAHAEFAELPDLPQLSLCYSGYKTPTGEVLAKIADASRGKEAQYADLYARMGNSAAKAIQAVRQRDEAGLAAELEAYQDMMVELGVSDPVLEKIIGNADAAMAAKISGSGLGDCVVALGEIPSGFTPVQVAREGVIVNG